MATQSLQLNEIVQDQQGLSRDQLAQKAREGTLPVANIPQTPQISTTQAEIPTVIDSSMLGGKSPVRLPTQQSSMPSPFLNPLEGVLQSMEVEETATQKAYKENANTLYSLLPKLQGEAATLAQEENNAGVGQKKQEFQAINSRILQLDAEIAQDDVQLIAEARQIEKNNVGIIDEIVTNLKGKASMDAQIVRALKQSEKGVLVAQAQAKLGDVGLAMETAKRATEVKYAPYKEAINTLNMQREVLKDIFNADEAKQAKKEELRLNLVMKQIEKQEQKELKIAELSVEASKYGATGDQLRKIQSSQSLSEAVYHSAGFLGRKFEEELIQNAFQNELALGKLEMDMASQGGFNGLSKEQVSIAQGTRKDFISDPDVKGYIDIRDAYERIQASVKQNSPAGDLALIFNYMKMLDPGSTVREGEFANAQNAAGVPDQIRNLFNKAQTGERLQESQRTDFLNTAASIYEPKLRKYQAAKGAYENELNTFGIDPTIVLRNLEPTKLPTPITGPIFGKDSLVNKYPYQEAQAIVSQVPNITEDELVRVLKGKGFNIVANFNEKGSGNVVAQKLSSVFKTGQLGGECGTFAHKIVDFPSVGDMKSEKFASVDKYGVRKESWVPKVGDVVITGEHPKYGHVAVVNQILPGGKIQLTESNYKGDKKVTHSRVVSPRDSVIYGAIPGKLNV